MAAESKVTVIGVHMSEDRPMPFSMRMNIMPRGPEDSDYWGWRVCQTHLEEFEGDQLIVCAPETASGGERIEYLEGLPTEFFAHELEDMNVKDYGDLLRFTSRWGIPVAPAHLSEDSHSVRRQDVYPPHKQGDGTSLPSLEEKRDELKRGALRKGVFRDERYMQLIKHDESFWVGMEESTASSWLHAMSEYHQNKRSEGRSTTSYRSITRVASTEEVSRTISALRDATLVLSLAESANGDYREFMNELRISAESHPKRKTYHPLLKSVWASCLDRSSTIDNLTSNQLLRDYLTWIGRDLIYFISLYLKPLVWHGAVDSLLPIDQPDRWQPVPERLAARTIYNSGTRRANHANAFSLGNAIAIQFYNELDVTGNGNHSWQRCDYCERLFKYQRADDWYPFVYREKVERTVDGHKEEHLEYVRHDRRPNDKPVWLPSNKRSGTKFCSKSHSVMQVRRLNNQRLAIAIRLLEEGKVRDEIVRTVMEHVNSTTKQSNEYYLRACAVLRRKAIIDVYGEDEWDEHMDEHDSRLPYEDEWKQNKEWNSKFIKRSAGSAQRVKWAKFVYRTTETDSLQWEASRPEDDPQFGTCHSVRRRGAKESAQPTDSAGEHSTGQHDDE
jgi:hypothetical protein